MCSDGNSAPIAGRMSPPAGGRVNGIRASIKARGTCGDAQVDELADIIRTYRGLEAEEDEGQEGLPWCDSPLFDTVICMIILLNIFVISLEMDLGDDDKTGYDRAAVWICFEWLFCLIFIAEVGIKVHFHSMNLFREDPWSWLSLGIATMAFVEVAILSPIKMQGLRIVSLVRIVNLLRLRRVIEHSKYLKELKLVIRGMLGSWASLCWAVIVLVGIVFVFSIWTTTLIGYQEGFQDLLNDTNGWSSEDLFGSIGRSMFTLVQIMTLDNWCSGIVRHVASREWYMIGFFSIFLLLTTYGILNLIIAIIVEQTLTASQHSETRVKAREERARHLESETLREIFMIADVGSHGDLGLEMFEKACLEHAEVRWRMRTLELPLEDVKRLFQVMDGDGSRSLNMKEFMDGCSKLKGPARSKELLALQSQADNMSKKMDLMAFELQDTERMLGRLDTATRRMGSRFGPTALSARQAVRERVRGSAPLVPLPNKKKGSYCEDHLSVGNMPRLPKLPNLVN